MQRRVASRTPITAIRQDYSYLNYCSCCFCLYPNTTCLFIALEANAMQRTSGCCQKVPILISFSSLDSLLSLSSIYSRSVRAFTFIEFINETPRHTSEMAKLSKRSTAYHAPLHLRTVICISYIHKAAVRFSRLSEIRIFIALVYV